MIYQIIISSVSCSIHHNITSCIRFIDIIIPSSSTIHQHHQHPFFFVKPYLNPATQYKSLETFWDDEDDAPGPRCAHTLTAVTATKTHGPRLILFSGATAIEGGKSSVPSIRLKPAGEPPSPRAAHCAAAVGTMVVFQGGIGPAGHSTDDLYVLDMTNDKYKWHSSLAIKKALNEKCRKLVELLSNKMSI